MVQSCCSQPRCLGQAALLACAALGVATGAPPPGWPMLPTGQIPRVVAPDRPEGEVALPLGPLRDRLQERLDAHREASGAPGATLAVVLPGGEDLAIASGLAERDDRFPMSVDHRMLAGAVGKTLAAAIVVLLADEGVVGLDAPLSDLLGDLPWFSGLPNAGTLTLRRLLNHTSGLPDHMTSPEFIRAVREDPARAWSPEQVVAHVIGRDPLFPAGEGWSYADTNFVIAGLAVERATGRSFGDLLWDMLIEPLGLIATSPSNRPDLERLAPGYTTADNAFGLPEQTARFERYAINPQFESIGGGLVTTTLDLARWGDCLYGGRLLPGERLDEVIDGVACGMGPGVRYGLGTTIWPSAHGDVMGHSGTFPGYVSMLCHYPDLGVTVAFQQNSDIRPRMEAIRRLMDATAGAAATTASLARPPTAPVPPSPPTTNLPPAAEEPRS